MVGLFFDCFHVFCSYGSRTYSTCYFVVVGNHYWFSGDFFEGRPLQLEVVFDRRTVLATTFTILILAAGFVAVVVTGALIVLVRIGRRELARKANDAGSQERGRP